MFPTYLLPYLLCYYISKMGGGGPLPRRLLIATT